MSRKQIISCGEFATINIKKKSRLFHKQMNSNCVACCDAKSNGS